MPRREPNLCPNWAAEWGRFTKRQVKTRDRLIAWAKGEPFRENSRAERVVPNLTHDEVLEQYIAPWPKLCDQHFTPIEMMEDLWQHIAIDIEKNSRILEPSAGIGHLFHHFYNHSYAPVYVPATAQVDAYEVDTELVYVGQRLFPQVNWYRDTPFHHLDTIEGQYDIVLMNPPFTTRRGMGSAECWGAYVGAKKTVHLFMALATHALVVGGLAVVIAPSNVLDSMTRIMRTWFDERMELVGKSYQPLRGKFQFTSASVHAFFFERLPEPVAPPSQAPLF